jgi:hypothetical protein
VDVRRLRDGVFARADLAHDLAFGDGAATRDRDRAELEQRHGVTVRRLDRQRASAGRDGACERDDAGCGRPHCAACGRADVDSPVLAYRIVVLGEREGPQDRPVGGPNPAGRGRDDDQGRDRSDDRDGEHAPHEVPPS